MGTIRNLFGNDKNRLMKSKEHFDKGVRCDNAGDLAGAINHYSKAIRIDNHPMAYYHRACVYKDMGKYKEAIGDFKSYLKYGPQNTNEARASKITIEELERKTASLSKIQGERSSVLCPRCKTPMLITARNVQGMMGSQQLHCPGCGMSMIKPK